MNILVIAAHPDDEVLGCGGTIARHKKAGAKVEVCFMTDGVSARRTSKSKDVQQRRFAALKAQKILGVSKIYFNDFPDNAMDKLSLRDVIICIEKIINKVKPSIIYTHYHGDLNIDHQITHQATMTACRPQPKCPVKQIFGFEVASSTGWTFNPLINYQPNRYVNISDTLGIKTKALKAYQEEMRPAPHARSFVNLKNLAQFRGGSVGVAFAEAFYTYRELI